MAFLADCETCMLNTTKPERQANGCGYEPPAPPRVLVQVWTPPTGRVGFNLGKATPTHPRGQYSPTTCAGYTTKLPEVLEAARASAWLKRGDLRAFVDDETPGENLVDAIDIHDGAVSAKDAYYTTPADKGGGAG